MRNTLGVKFVTQEVWRRRATKGACAYRVVLGDCPNASIHRVAEKKCSRKLIFTPANPYALGPGQSPFVDLVGIEGDHKMLWCCIKIQFCTLP